MTRPVVVFLAGVCVLLVPKSAEAFTLWLNTDNYRPYDECNGGITPGGTRLSDLDYLPADCYDIVVTQLEDQYPGFDYDISDVPLQGDMTVDWYKAFDREYGAVCRHGAEITAHYDQDDDDPPVSLDWIQLYTEHGGSGNDWFEVDGTEDGKPFYFTDYDDPNDYIHVPNPGGLVFGDTPYDSHDEAQQWSGGVEFYLLLASMEGSSITIYDGIIWGYDGECVPEPSSLMLLALGGLVALRRRRVQRV